jgi:hypothetical protein
MEVAIVSDTHVPDREREIPAPFRERIRAADHAIHAGDFTAPEVLAEVRDLAADLTAVHGNVDPDLGLPSVASVEVGGVTFVVTHGHVDPVTGDRARGREGWLDAVAGAARDRGGDGDPLVAVGGHSHRLTDAVHDGVRTLNPGSVTGADPASAATMLTAAVEDGAVDLTVHEL